MYFLPGFITTYLPLFINVLERSYKDESGNIIKVVYPPQSYFILQNNTGITFTAFQKFVEEDVAVVSINEINNLIFLKIIIWDFMLKFWMNILVLLIRN